MSIPTEAQKKRSSLWFGLILIAAGIWMVGESVQAYRTGDVIHRYGHGTLEWWEQLPLGVGAILVGALSADFIQLKPKG